MRGLVAVLLCAAPVGAEPLARPPGQPLVLTQTRPLRGVIQLALGAQHSCARRHDGSVVCWGDGGEGQRGDGERGDSPTPTTVQTFSNLVTIASGSLHSCALTTTDIWCWGNNNVYQLGVGDATRPTASVSGVGRARPTRSRRFGTPSSIALGDVSYAVDAAGAVTCIGHSNYCGWETASRKVADLPPIATLAVGDGHACAVTRTGEVHCWGRTDWGQGGSGLDHTDQSPTKVEGLGNVVEIAAGGAHTCARTKDGNVYCWGLNDHGQLGDGTTTQRNRPIKLRLARVEQLALGGFGSCARFADGTVACWGAHQDVPNIDHSKGGQTLAPARLALSNVVEIAAGGAHMCARLRDDTVRCWGLNSNGQLGDGSTRYSAGPVTVVAANASP
jgi:alpha-tubulin suppressor-like RCC1 family protein